MLTRLVFLSLTARCVSWQLKIRQQGHGWSLRPSCLAHDRIMTTFFCTPWPTFRHGKDMCVLVALTGTRKLEDMLTHYVAKRIGPLLQHQLRSHRVARWTPWRPGSRAARIQRTRQVGTHEVSKCNYCSERSRSLWSTNSRLFWISSSGSYFLVSDSWSVSCVHLRCLVIWPCA